MRTDALNWTEKYRPTTLSEVQGNNSDIDDIQAWAINWTEGDSPLLLHGPPGVGKTATVHALANDMDWPVLDVNASDSRTTDEIREIANLMRSKSARADRQLVFLDEVDGFKETVNLDPLKDGLKDPANPVILVGNDDWKIPQGVKYYCDEYEFSLSKGSIKAKLKEIAAAEDIHVDKMTLGRLATRGNLRAAINDLQQYAQSGHIGWDERDTSIDNFDMVDNILRGTRYTGDMTPDEVVVWLGENLTEEFRGLEAAMAYDALARADRWLGRVQKTKNYTWWRYAGELADRTAELRLSEPYEGWLDKSYPQYYRLSTPTPEDDSPEAVLYRQLKGYETGEFGFGGSFTYFRRVLLPLLMELPKGIRYRLAADSGLQPEDDALEALGISESEYKGWIAQEIEDDQDSLADW